VNRAEWAAMTDDELLELVTPEPNTGCWIWLGATGGKGYAQARVGKDRDQVTRLLLGITDPAAQALHRCDLPPCVNRSHLIAGDALGNFWDMVAKGRGAHPGHTVSDDCPRCGSPRRWGMWGGERLRICDPCNRARAVAQTARRCLNRKLFLSASHHTAGGGERMDPATLKDNVSRNLKEQRLRKKLSQERLAAKANLSLSYISELERGNRTPTLPAIEKIAAALGIPSQRLLANP
jgi:ribosome-binding protein aMBF1 (putative translation factor)